jgi:hypothetical protein
MPYNILCTVTSCTDFQHYFRAAGYNVEQENCILFINYWASRLVNNRDSKHVPYLVLALQHNSNNNGTKYFWGANKWIFRQDPHAYENQKSVTLKIRAYNLCILWVTWIWSTDFNPNGLRSVLIIYCHQGLCIAGWLISFSAWSFVWISHLSSVWRNLPYYSPLFNRPVAYSEHWKWEHYSLWNIFMAYTPFVLLTNTLLDILFSANLNLLYSLTITRPCITLILSNG